MHWWRGLLGVRFGDEQCAEHVDDHRHRGQSGQQADENEYATTDLEDPSRALKNAGAGIPVLSNLPVPSEAGRKNFSIPSQANTRPTALST